MPGWYIHLDVAQEVARALPRVSPTLGPLSHAEGNRWEVSSFASEGPSPEELARIIKTHPNFYALGAIGPDLFFLLPDFKGKVGNSIAKIAEWVLDKFNYFDEHVIGPWEDKLGPISENENELVSRLTGDLQNEIGKVANYASSIITEALIDFATRLYDWFGILGSGPAPAYDDALFYWSDMFHYRRTSEFACNLFKLAVENAYDEDGLSTPVSPKGGYGYEAGIAFALGWMTHVGTDVTGHPLVNEKAGGPFRLHWQRHHLIENHMDAHVYDVGKGTSPLYDRETMSALHFWVQFRSSADNTPKYDYFRGVDTNDPDLDPDAPTAPLPKYPTGLNSRNYYDRKKIFDVDSDIPPALVSLISEAMRRTFYVDHTTATNGGMPTHPLVLAAVTGGDGRPDLKLMQTNYELFYKYLKLTTTDHFKLPKPQPPDVFPDNLNPPIPPGNDDPPSEQDSSWDFWDALLAIFAWVLYLAEWVGYLLTLLPGMVMDLATYSARMVLYQFEEAFYEMWKAFRYLLVMEGFVLPEPDEIDLGLVQLGTPGNGPFIGLLAIVDDVFGGLLNDVANPVQTEPVPDPLYPRDTVIDDPTIIQKAVAHIEEWVNPTCPQVGPPADARMPSEFLRPWEYPFKNNAHVDIGTELGRTRAGPYPLGALPTVLLGTMPGTDEARKAYEAAKTPLDTDCLNADVLSPRWNLGDAIHYSLYVVGQLTRDAATTDPTSLPNFNLDGDRGYAYKCWDYDRRAGCYQVDPKTIFARYQSAVPPVEYGIPCTPPRAFDKSQVCGTGSTAYVTAAELDYDPTKPLHIHYLGKTTPEESYPECGANKPRTGKGGPPVT